jgi:hypothetical protein
MRAMWKKGWNDYTSTSRIFKLKTIIQVFKIVLEVPLVGNEACDWTLLWWISETSIFYLGLDFFFKFEKGKENHLNMDEKL